MESTELKKWNWGAFTLNIFWGIGNQAYLTLLCIIPVFNIVWAFICGAKGNQWAYEAGGFNNIDEYLKTQESWNRVGFVFFIIQIISIIFISLIFIIYLFVYSY